MGKSQAEGSQGSESIAAEESMSALPKLQVDPKVLAVLQELVGKPQTFTPPEPEPEPEHLVVEHIYEIGHPTDRILDGHFLERVAEERA